MRLRLIVIIGGLATIGFAFGGCSNEFQQSESTVGQVGKEIASVQVTLDDSPLSKYRDNALPEYQDSSQAGDLDRMIQESIAQCMNEAGFEFIPVVDPNYRPADIDVSGTIDPIAYAWQYGYGDNMWSWLEAEQSESTGDTDPNDTRYQQMSESEKAAYDEALMGKTDELSSTGGGEDEYVWQDHGCLGRSSQEVTESSESVQSVFEDPQWAELQDRMSAIGDLVQSSLPMAELDQKWGICMAEKNLGTFSSPADSRGYVSEKSSHLNLSEIGEVSADELNELKEEEIKIAVGDYTCQAELDYEEKKLLITFDLEQKFLDQNRDQLDAFLMAIEASDQNN